MIVLDDSRRNPSFTLWLGGTTAGVAGLVNVCSVIAFFAFASNVTGHVAIVAQELVSGHFHQVAVVVTWVATFMGGAFTGNFLITAVGSRAHRLGRAAPVLLEIGVLALVGWYGEVHYTETLTETEYLVGLLLFAMGLHNGTVATVSDGAVKTTHLTGLATSLGMELSLLAQGKIVKGSKQAFQMKLHLVILSWYLGGGIVGAALFLRAGFVTFFAGASVLAGILASDAFAYYLERRRAEPTRALALLRTTSDRNEGTRSIRRPTRDD